MVDRLLSHAHAQGILCENISVPGANRIINVPGPEMGSGHMLECEEQWRLSICSQVGCSWACGVHVHDTTSTTCMVQCRGSLQVWSKAIACCICCRGCSRSVHVQQLLISLIQYKLSLIHNNIRLELFRLIILNDQTIIVIAKAIQINVSKITI